MIKISIQFSVSSLINTYFLSKTGGGEEGDACPRRRLPFYDACQFRWRAIKQLGRALSSLLSHSPEFNQTLTGGDLICYRRLPLAFPIPLTPPLRGGKPRGIVFVRAPPPSPPPPHPHPPLRFASVGNVITTTLGGGGWPRYL